MIYGKSLEKNAKYFIMGTYACCKLMKICMEIPYHLKIVIIFLWRKCKVIYKETLITSLNFISLKINIKSKFGHSKVDQANKGKMIIIEPMFSNTTPFLFPFSHSPITWINSWSQNQWEVSRGKYSNCLNASIHFA